MAASALPGPARYDFALVGAFRYPAGDASSNRLLALAKAVTAAGFRPLVINDAAPLDHNGDGDEIRRFGGVDYVNTGRSVRGRLSRLLIRLGRPVRLVRMIRSAGFEPKSIASVSSGLYTPGVHLGLKCLLRMTTISDVVERHDAGQFADGRRSPYFLRHRWTSFLSRFLPDGVIAVSRELESIYQPRRPVLRVPPLVDLDEFPAPRRRLPSQPLTLIYSGTPTRKDQLGSLVDAVLANVAAGRPMTFVIAGADAAQLASSDDVGSGRVASFGDVVRPMGTLGRAEVIEQLQRADFCVLLRPLDGYAQAGFPSKVPESLAAGCPILGNLTSDLGDYLRDQDNALLCAPDPSTRLVSVMAVQATLDRASRMTDEQLYDMKVAARASAEEFHYAHWGPIMRRWLGTLHD